MESFAHETVLKKQAVAMLAIKPNMTVIDCTAGGGGHTSELLKCLDGQGLILAFDQDPRALAYLEKKFSMEIEKGLVRLISENFDQIDNVCDRMKLRHADAILADIGVSSPQIDEADRGFSFQKDGPLDMRMNTSSQDETAADVVNNYDERDLSRIFFQLGEEPKAKFVAQAIVKYRSQNKIDSTAQLAEIVKGAIHYSQKSKKHPATKTFQALRIHVNRELEVLSDLIQDGFKRLSVGGRLAIITFHSLEDRIVKKAFKELSSVDDKRTQLRGLPLTEQQMTSSLKAKIIKPFPQIPSDEEIQINPRARSAKLRVIEKLKDETQEQV